ncbi:MAG: LysM domain-containing protein [Ferruginibacter sp.]
MYQQKLLSLQPSPWKKTKTAKTYIVAAKEGLYAIARKFNVSVQQLREWNGLKNDSLRIGQELIISK